MKVKTLGILGVALLMGGCATAQFRHSVYDPKTETVTKTELSYVRWGGQDVKGLEAKAPTGWEVGFDSQKSQEIEIETIVTKIVAALEGLQ